MSVSDMWAGATDLDRKQQAQKVVKENLPAYSYKIALQTKLLGISAVTHLLNQFLQSEDAVR